MRKKAYPEVKFIPMQATKYSSSNRPIAYWLLLCAASVFAMILLGGVTRLTHSGLSMVEWKPLMGTIPPLSEEAWMETFEKYQQYPEYQKINRGMSLADFKEIFLFEYAHRVLGRTIGILFLFPMLYFWIKGHVNAYLKPRLVILFLLGGFQGLLGWYMVKSGLVNNPHVSQYRLTAHLGAAVVIYGYMLWLAFRLLFPERESAPIQGLRTFAHCNSALIFLMILSGGLVAGTRAGFIYNTFPLMKGQWIPSGLYGTEPPWRALFEDLTTVQFNHRILAYLLFVLITVFVIKVWRHRISGRLLRGATSLGFMLLVQLTLGISTLLLLVPVSLAAAHQGGAILLFSAALFVSHELSSRSS